MHGAMFVGRYICCAGMMYGVTENKRYIIHTTFTVGKIAGKAVCKSVFLTIWHCILLALFGDFAHWVSSLGKSPNIDKVGA